MMGSCSVIVDEVKSSVFVDFKHLATEMWESVSESFYHAVCKGINAFCTQDVAYYELCCNKPPISDNLAELFRRPFCVTTEDTILARGYPRIRSPGTRVMIHMDLATQNPLCDTLETMGDISKHNATDVQGSNPDSQAGNEGVALNVGGDTQTDPSPAETTAADGNTTVLKRRRRREVDTSSTYNVPPDILLQSMSGAETRRLVLKALTDNGLEEWGPTLDGYEVSPAYNEDEATAVVQPMAAMDSKPVIVITLAVFFSLLGTALLLLLVFFFMRSPQQVSSSKLQLWTSESALHTGDHFSGEERDGNGPLRQPSESNQAEQQQFGMTELEGDEMAETEKQVFSPRSESRLSPRPPSAESASGMKPSAMDEVLDPRGATPIGNDQ